MFAPRIPALTLGLVLGVVASADLQAARTGGGGGGKPRTADTTPPALAVPGDISVEAVSATGSLVRFTVTAVDNLDGSITPSCTPTSGTTFPLGRTSVSCQARDRAGNRSMGVFTVVVRDTAAPTIGLPGTVLIETPDLTGTAVNFAVTALDRVDPTPTLGCTPGSGSRFPIGTTTVHCSASDDSGNNTSEDFNVTVAVSTTASNPPPPPPPAGYAALSWSVPMTRADGSPLSPSELAGYEIYVLTESSGTTSVISIGDPMATQYTLNGLTNDIYHFAVGAVDTAGHISELSQVVSKQIR